MDSVGRECFGEASQEHGREVHEFNFQCTVFLGKGVVAARWRSQ